MKTVDFRAGYQPVELAARLVARTGRVINLLSRGWVDWLCWPGRSLCANPLCGFGTADK
jgi:hypothetical protein